MLLTPLLTVRLPRRLRAALAPSTRALLAALALAASACAPPLQNGGVEVVAGAVERLEVLCRFRSGDAAQRDLCGMGDEAPLPAVTDTGPASPAASEVDAPPIPGSAPPAADASPSASSFPVGSPNPPAE
jgi:hypothetical protein